jgi:hypothetical protein
VLASAAAAAAAAAAPHQGSNCVAGYKLMGGKVMDIGRSKDELKAQQDAGAKKSGAGAAAGAPTWGAALLLAVASALLL